MISVWYGKNRLMIKRYTLKGQENVDANVSTLIYFGVEILKRINKHNFEAYEVGEYTSIILKEHASKTSKKILEAMFYMLCDLSEKLPDSIKIEVGHEKENICN